MRYQLRQGPVPHGRSVRWSGRPRFDATADHRTSLRRQLANPPWFARFHRRRFRLSPIGGQRVDQVTEIGSLFRFTIIVWLNTADWS